MKEYVEEMLGEDGHLTIELCKEFGLKEYDPTQYYELETLGSGAFGVVRKCKYIPKHELHAVKTITIQGIRREIMLNNIASFLVEAEISKNLLKIQHPNLAIFKDNWYIIDLITEAGDI
jgi:hypothetical protein